MFELPQCKVQATSLHITAHAAMHRLKILQDNTTPVQQWQLEDIWKELEKKKQFNFMKEFIQNNISFRFYNFLSITEHEYIPNISELGWKKLDEE